MEDADRILCAIAELDAKMDGFGKRLDKLQKKSHGLHKKQKRVEARLDKLEHIVRNLAENEPLKTWPDGTVAIDNNRAGEMMEAIGVPRRQGFGILVDHNVIYPSDSETKSTRRVRIGKRLVHALVILPEDGT